MENQEYLNQISAQVKPAKKSRGGLLTSKFFIVGLIGIAALIIIVVVGMALGGGDSNKDLSYALKLHLDNTSEVIQEYQSDVKSSALRSSSASLYSVLANTSKELTDYITEKYNFKAKNVSKKLTQAATLTKDGLEQDLFEAKINGILDRIYAHKMAYEISLIASEETKLINATNNTTFKELLTKSYNSLDTLYDEFNDFSETN